MIFGCGIALFTCSAFWYRLASFLLFFVAVYIWISRAYTSSSCVPFFRSSVPSSFWHDLISSLMIRCRLPYSARSNHSFPSLRFVLNHSRSFFASCSAVSVVS